MTRQAFEVPMPDGTTHYFETGSRMFTHAVIAMCEHGHMEGDQFIVDRIRWGNWRNSMSERAAKTAMNSFVLNYHNRISKYDTNDYRRYSDFRVVATRAVERHKPMRWKATLPDGKTVQRVSQSSVYTHLLIHFLEVARKDAEGNFNVIRSEWIVHDPFVSQASAEERLKLILGYDGINAAGEWHKRSYHSYGDDDGWVRHSQHQIIALEPVTPRKKKAAVV